MDAFQCSNELWGRCDRNLGMGRVQHARWFQCSNELWGRCDLRRRKRVGLRL